MSRLFEGLKKHLAHPLTRNIAPDSPEANDIFLRIIEAKPFLKEIYRSWYKMLAGSLPGKPDGPVLELGSGAGFLHEYIPGLIRSEIQPVSSADIALDARALPFPDNSLKAIVMVDVFHHIPDVAQFLAEAERCLRPGGVVSMIEPWVTPWSKFVYKHLHHEPFLPDAEEWRFPEGGRMSVANSALPWMVFERDRQLLKQYFPYIELVGISLHTPFSYLLSGGVTMRAGLPACLFSLCSRLEDALQPYMVRLAMFAFIVARKIGR
ncbi:MAG: class I SAM-dependent methyltransferase [Dissulfuribacterales bacterium]